MSFNDEIDFDYNDCHSIESLSRKLEILYHDFKSSLPNLASTGPKNRIYDRFFQIKVKIDEADILINPRDKDLVFARITILGSSRLALTKPQMDMLKSILINYVRVQRSYLKLIKGTTKNIANFYAPELVIRSSKQKIKGQQTLSPPNSPKTLKWQSETIELLELGASLAVYDQHQITQGKYCTQATFCAELVSFIKV